MTIVGYHPVFTGQRIVDATPRPGIDGSSAGGGGVADADRLDELVSASVRASLTTRLLDGPQVIYRFCHGADARALEDGVASWWTAEDPFGGALTTARQAAAEHRPWVFRDVMRKLRLLRAIDWHRDAYVRTLRIPQGVSLRVLASEVAAPLRSRDAAAAGGSGVGGRFRGPSGSRRDGTTAGGPSWRRSIQYVLIVSQAMASGLSPSEPRPLASYLASHR